MRRRRAGFGLVSALFVLVVLAGSGAVMLRLTGVQRQTSVAALQAVRAYHAARSAIEWGAWQALNTGACPPPTSFTAAEGGLVGFDVQVDCTSSRHQDQGATATVYQLFASARYGSFGDPDYVSRRIRLSFTDAGP